MNETKNYSITKSGAVILEGGANRGVFTAGALDFLMEQEYYIPHVIGVSAGACNALDYVSRQIGRTRDCMIVTDEKNRYVNKNIKTIVEKKALLDMDMVFERYPYEIIPFDFDTYFASPQTCELVVTNCETGRAEYLDDRENKERLLAIGRASSSMPIACPMVEIDGNEYVDGGVADSIPIIRSLKTGHRKNVIILTRNFGYRKKEGTRGWELYVAAFRKYPNLVRALVNRAKHYNQVLECIEKWEEEGKIFVIRPSVPLTIGRMEADPKKIKEVYELGRDDARRQIEDMKVFLGIE